MSTKFILTCAGVLVLLLSDGKAQDLFRYDSLHPSARVLYNKFLFKFNRSYDLKKAPEYPATGAYSPTKYSNGPLGIEPDCGYSNYIYIPTEGKLEPGKQYTLTMTIQMDEAYDQLTFFQDNFGMALTSYLYANDYSSYWGLWRHPKESIGFIRADELVTVEMEFRPLARSNYFVLGVFKGREQDYMSCFGCEYPFELHELTISESGNPNRPCRYFADAFKDVPPDPDQKEVTIYFDSGSSVLKEVYKAVLDSIPTRINTDEDMILLSGFTDMSGSDNERLGAARNEVVRQALLDRGLPDKNILRINHADTRSANTILSTDRKVEIDLGKGKVYKKLYEAALEATEKEDYPTAHKILLKEWINLIPAKKAIYALHDCWGNNDEASLLKDHLKKAIKNKFYRTHHLRFTLDSLYAEWLKGRTLSGHLSLNRMPGSEHDCHFSIDAQRDSMLRKEADRIFSSRGFPDQNEVGRRGNSVLPLLIMTSDDIDYLDGYLTSVESACAEGKLQWSVYANLYDMISVLRHGFQRYGTEMIRGDRGTMIPKYPFEDENMVNEYRRQVKLAPFPSLMKEEIKESQSKLDRDLVELLNDVYRADQHFRNRVDNKSRNYKKWKTTDSLNQVQVRKILDERGWLGPEIVGHQGSAAIFLVIQHSDLQTQLKYLPMMRSAVQKGGARGRDLALLEDRVALGQGKKQIYGSQIYTNPETGSHYVAPIENPESVNVRRAEVGLNAIEDYVKRWNIVWDVDEHRMRSKNHRP